jgi:D-xylose transport system ATP-binding protein
VPASELTSPATPPAGSGSDVVLSVRNVSKRYGHVNALTDVSIDVGRGEIVALVGDNGAGKSTLMKVIAGAVAPDSGEIVVDGTAHSFRGPNEATAAGIESVYQDLALPGNLDIVSNLFLGRELTRRGSLDEPAMEARTAKLLKTLDVKIPSLRVPIAALSGGQRQAVAVARSRMWNNLVVQLDEPTAALGVAQTRQVLELIRRLGDEGVGVIFISHNMPDVLSVADRIVVLRLGRNAGEFQVKDASIDGLIAAITGAGELSETGARADLPPSTEES